MNLFDLFDNFDSQVLGLINLKKINLDGTEPFFKQRHSHSVYEFYVNLCGTYVLNVDSEVFTVEEGTAFLISPGVFHVTKDASPDLRRISISFKLNEGRSSEVTDILNAKIYDFKVDEDLLAFCKKVFLAEGEKSFFVEEVNSVANILLIELLRDIGVVEQPTERKQQEKLEDMRSQKIDSFFDKRLFDDVTSDMLAQELFISNRQLNRIMKKTYGMTFSQKLIAGRMDHAAWLLSATDKTVAQISLEVGYESKSYFYRVFQNRYKLSPSEYRKKMRAENENNKTDGA